MRLGIFFTYKMGFADLKRTGEYSRRLSIYAKYQEKFDELLFFTYDKTKDTSVQHMQLLPGKKSPFWFSLFGPLKHRKELQKCDVLMTNQMMGSWAAVIAKIVAGKPLVIRQGYSWFLFEKRGGGFFKRRVSRFSEFIALLFGKQAIVTSEDQKKSLSSINLLRRPITVIPNGIDVEKFKPMNVKKRPGSLITVGRLHHQKNHHNLLRAIRGLDVTLTIVGEGALEKSLKELADHLGVQVSWLNNIPNEDLPRLLNSHEIFVFPSLYEGNPKTLIEAMACGLPVVASDVEGNRDVISHKKNGFLHGTAVEDIHEALTTVLEDKKLRDVMAEQARKTAEGKYSMMKNAGKEAEVLKHVIS